MSAIIICFVIKALTFTRLLGYEYNNYLFCDIYQAGDSNQMKTIVAFDCRGMEPIDFSPRVSTFLCTKATSHKLCIFHYNLKCSVGTWSCLLAMPCWRGLKRSKQLAMADNIHYYFLSSVGTWWACLLAMPCWRGLKRPKQLLIKSIVARSGVSSGVILHWSNCPCMAASIKT